MKSTKQQRFNGAKPALRMFIIAISMSILWPMASYATYTVAAGTTDIETGTWHPAGDVIVYGKLQINAGTTVEMDAGAKISVQEDGRLKAVGTSGSRITFTESSSTPWIGIEILGNQSISHQPSVSDADNMIISSYGSGTDGKGAAYMTYCTVQYTNFGIVVGQINSGYTVSTWSGYDPSGGGTLYSTNNTFQNNEYAAIIFSPYNSKTSNTSSITSCKFYCNFNIAIALFGVNLSNALDYEIVYSSALGGALYSQQSGFTLSNSYIRGCGTGVAIEELQNSYAKNITGNTFVNVDMDIDALATYNTNIIANTSTIDSTPILLSNTRFTQVSGDNFYLSYNNMSLSTPDNGGITVGIWYPEPSTPLGKKTYENTMTDYARGIQSQNSNYGMMFLCNTFNNTYWDIAVSSGGVLSPQGSSYAGDVNYFHSGCTGITHWDQNSGVSAVTYYYNSFGEPTCDNITTNGTSQYPISCPDNKVGSVEPNGSNGTKTSLAVAVDSISVLPASPALMTSSQLVSYKYYSAERDFYLGRTIQLYVNAAMYDSAFYMMSAYPCQRANIDKMNLLLTLDSAYSNYSSLITAISNGFSLCSDGSGYCDNIYYDSILSAQASTYYPIVMDLMAHNFSDSALSAYDATLVSLTSASSYYSGCAQTILQMYHDSLWKELIPHDSTYVRSVLYPPTLDDIDGGGGSTSPFAHAAKNLQNLNWKIFPNPASDFLNITSGNVSGWGNETIQYKIYDVLGNEAESGSFVPGDGTGAIDIIGLNSGVFILELNNAASIQKYKFIHQ